LEYLLERKWYSGFKYTFKGGKLPPESKRANLVLGYVKSPYGIAEILANGGSRWKKNRHGHYLSEGLDLDVGIRVMKRIMLDSHPKGWQDSRYAARKAIMKILLSSLLVMAFFVGSFLTYMSSLDADSYARNAYHAFLSLFTGSAPLSYPGWYWLDQKSPVYWVVEATYLLVFLSAAWAICFRQLPKMARTSCIVVATSVMLVWSAYVFLPIAEADGESESILTIAGYCIVAFLVTRILRPCQVRQPV
jgi:hypothetical protein